MNIRYLFIFFLLIAISSVGLFAQEDASPIAQAVEISVSDGLVIKGSFYASSSEEAAPAILLLHHLGGARAEWEELTSALLEDGYNVLTVDQRGAGETGGTADWELAETDAIALMAWLREQETVDPAKVAVGGASIGGNIAIRACAADEACNAVVALSAGQDFMGVTTEDAVSSMEAKAIFLVSSQNDPYATQVAAEILTADAPSSVTVTTQLFARGTEHGTAMFVHENLIPMIVTWLDEYAG